MSRVLVTAGADPLGAAVVRRLLGDPRFDVRVCDLRPMPQWMREGAEIHTGDLSVLDEARRAAAGCGQIVHLGPVEPAGTGPYTRAERSGARLRGVIRAALDQEVERLVYVSSAAVLDGASVFPTPEEHLLEAALPRSPEGLMHLAGEVLVRAAHAEHGLAFSICRPSDPYGPGEVEPGDDDVVGRLIAAALAGDDAVAVPGTGEATRTPTHVADVAAGIVAALASPAGVNEDFNLAGDEELPLTEIARVAWEACGRQSAPPALHPAADARNDGPQRRSPTTEKAQRLLDWRAELDLADGLAGTVTALRARQGH